MQGIPTDLSKGKRYGFRPDIPIGSAHFTLITPQVLELTLSLISLGRMQHIFCICSHSHITNFCSTWYPLQLGGQRWCGLKAFPRLYTWPVLRESNPRPLNLGSNILTTQPCTSKTITTPHWPAAHSERTRSSQGCVCSRLGGGCYWSCRSTGRRTGRGSPQEAWTHARSRCTAAGSQTLGGTAHCHRWRSTTRGKVKLCE